MPRYFFLVTNATPREASGVQLLERYRRRGATEKDYGDWFNALNLALSSTIGRTGGFMTLQLGASALGRGAILGRVLDDAGLPLRAARVSLLGTEEFTLLIGFVHPPTAGGDPYAHDDPLRAHDSKSGCTQPGHFGSGERRPRFGQKI